MYHAFFGGKNDQLVRDFKNIHKNCLIFRTLQGSSLLYTQKIARIWENSTYLGIMDVLKNKVCRAQHDARQAHDTHGVYHDVHQTRG